VPREREKIIVNNELESLSEQAVLAGTDGTVRELVSANWISGRRLNPLDMLLCHTNLLSKFLLGRHQRNYVKIVKPGNVETDRRQALSVNHVMKVRDLHDQLFSVILTYLLTELRPS
jgi:hypothetical protein